MSLKEEAEDFLDKIPLLLIQVKNDFLPCADAFFKNGKPVVKKIKKICKKKQGSELCVIIPEVAYNMKNVDEFYGECVYVGKHGNDEVLNLVQTRQFCIVKRTDMVKTLGRVIEQQIYPLETSDIIVNKKNP